MPLPTAFATSALVTTGGARFGIAVALFPADQSLDIEIERAPDSSGNPDTAQSESIAIVPASQGVYIDELPNDSRVYHYRTRHAVVGEDPSLWTCWKSNSAKALAAEYSAPGAVASTIREQPSETPSLGTLALDVADPQCRLTKVEFRTQSGGADWGAWVEDAVAPYSTTVALVEKQISRIGYRVTGYDALGAERVLVEQVVPFRAGTVPGAPQLDAQIDTAGNLVITVTGDSDAAFHRVQYSLSGPPSDPAVEAGFILNGRVATITLATAFGQNIVAYVGAFSYSATNLRSARANATTTKGQGGTDFAVREVTSETKTLGTLQLVLTDPTNRVSQVEVRTKAGPGQWTNYAPIANPYITNVALVEKHISFIQYRVSGQLQTGGIGILAEGKVPFLAGAQPAIPDVSIDCTESGVVTVYLNGDNDTQSFRLTWSTAAMPPDFAALFGTVYSNGSRRMEIPGLTALALGQRLYIKVVACSGINGDESVSTPASLAFIRQTVSAVKTKRFHVSEFVPGQDGWPYQFNGSGLYLRISSFPPGSNNWFIAPFTMADGVTIQQITARLFSGTSTSTASVQFSRVEETGTHVGLAGLAATQNAGWQSVTAFVSENTTGRRYNLMLFLNPSANNFNAGASYIDIVYSSPDHSKTE